MYNIINICDWCMSEPRLPLVLIVLIVLFKCTEALFISIKSSLSYYELTMFRIKTKNDSANSCPRALLLIKMVFVVAQYCPVVLLAH